MSHYEETSVDALERSTTSSMSATPRPPNEVPTLLNKKVEI